MSKQNKTVLEEIITNFFNVESDDLEALANWVKHTHLPQAEPKIAEFKAQLRHALDHPGIVTPAIFEMCTYNDEMDTQQAVQQRLQETWDACFTSSE